MKRGAILLLAAVAAACEGTPVVWADPVSTDVPDTMTRLVIDTVGELRWVRDTAARTSLPASPGRCTGSVRRARAGADVYAAWWAVLPDSSARMVTAASRDGGASWAPPVAVDTVDLSARGCDRPAPSIAATGSDVHVAYAMRSAEGTGVFLAHSMDRGATFHAPIPVSYGDRLVEAAVAVEGNVVAVAYEDPSGAPGAVRLALSRTQGHMIEVHMPASRSVDRATSPQVAVSGGRVAVAWIARDDRGTSAMARVGTIEK